LTPSSRQVSADKFIVERPFDLRLQSEAALTKVLVPAQIDYTVTVFNNGPEPATAVVLTNVLLTADRYVADPWWAFGDRMEAADGTVTVDTATASQGQASVAGQRVRWDVGGLEGFGKATLNVSIRADRARVVYSLATVSAAEVDPDLRDNQMASATL